MNDQTLRGLLSRLGDLERRAVRYRQGVITDDSPLSVALGGSDTPHPDVKALASYTATVGDVVAVLAFGNDLLVLGEIT